MIDGRREKTMKLLNLQNRERKPKQKIWYGLVNFIWNSCETLCCTFLGYW